MIQVKDLRKVYRVGNEQVVALGGIGFDIPAGQICCIVGTSGSGKSTLLNQLAGLEKPTRGQVLIGGQNISALSENELAQFRQRNVGFIFQSYNLIPSMTALENVSMPLIFRGMGRLRRQQAAKSILKEVGLGSRIRHTPSQMSGGQQQRVGIARAFVAKPKIVFADEPTGNLDTATTEEVMRMMVRLVRGNHQTLIIVTHESEIAAYGDRVITLRDGMIVSDTEHTPIWNPEPDSAEQPAIAEEERGNRDETN
jgi:putative ABC transport system ATP-binding protein